MSRNGIEMKRYKVILELKSNNSVLAISDAIYGLFLEDMEYIKVENLKA